MQIDPSELIPSDETAEILRVKTATLPSWRCQKKGPAYVKVGRAVFYRRSDVAVWLATQRHEPELA